MKLFSVKKENSLPKKFFIDSFALECSMISYDEKTCRLVGKIQNVNVDEKILTADGKIDVSKLNPIVYDPANHDYLKLGAKVGNAFKDGLQLK